MIERHVGHMVRLVDDLLDVSRITRGAITLPRQPIPIARCIEQAVEQASSLVEGRAQVLTVSPGREPLWVDADPARLVQVLGNLLTNASKFTPSRGRISLSADSLGNEEIVIRVCDTGVGIAPGTLPRVFEPFFQERNAIDRSQGGLGIGLTLVRNLVALHGGRVEAFSAGRGKGAELVVILPRVHVAPEFPATASIQPPGLVSRQLRLLIVEDNVDAAVSFQRLLELEGHEVRIVHDGIKALELSASCTPDVAFIDIGLPGLDGYELARRLREAPTFTATTLVALSGYGRDADKRRAAEAGFDRHFTKPVDIETVDALLAGVSALGPSLSGSALRH